MNGRPFIRNQIYHLSKSERSERGKFLAKVFQTQGCTLIFSWYADLYAASTVSSRHL